MENRKLYQIRQNKDLTRKNTIKNFLMLRQLKYVPLCSFECCKRKRNIHSFNSILGSASLLCILGITWIFGFTYFANGSEWMAVLFAMLNSLQGVFILLFHVGLNDKAKQELLRHIKSTKSEVQVKLLFFYLLYLLIQCPEAILLPVKYEELG